MLSDIENNVILGLYSQYFRRDQTEYTDIIHPIDRKELIPLKNTTNRFINLIIQKHMKILGIIPFSESLQQILKIPKIVKSIKETRLT